MATIKSYTDISQSRKLAKILPPESADTIWDLTNPDLPTVRVIPYEDSDYDNKYLNIIAAWSLTALLSVLPTNLQIALAINDFQSDRKEKYAIGSIEHDKYDCFSDNPVDACYEMILKLHELDLL